MTEAATDASTPIDAVALRARIERLARGREGTLDPIGVAHASRLLASAASRPDAARERILARASAAADSVLERVRSTQASAAARIESLSLAGFEVDGLRERLARGEARSVERVYRRAAVLGREPRRHDPAIEARLATLARSVGVGVEAARSGSLFDLADRLYRRVAAETSASLVLDRVKRTKPSDAGRYHGGTVGASILVAMQDVSPGYLAAQLARLELVGQIQRFLKAFEPIAPPVERSRPRPKATAKPRSKASAEKSNEPAAKVVTPEAPATKPAKPPRKPRGKKR